MLLIEIGLHTGLVRNMMIYHFNSLYNHKKVNKHVRLGVLPSLGFYRHYRKYLHQIVAKEYI